MQIMKFIAVGLFDETNNKLQIVEQILQPGVFVAKLKASTDLRNITWAAMRHSLLEFTRQDSPKKYVIDVK